MAVVLALVLAGCAAPHEPRPPVSAVSRALPGPQEQRLPIVNHRASRRVSHPSRRQGRPAT